MSKKKVKPKRKPAKKKEMKQLEPSIPQLMAVLNQLLEINGKLKVMNDRIANDTAEILLGIDSRLAEIETSIFGEPKAPPLQSVKAPDMELSDEDREAYAQAQQFAEQAIGMAKKNKEAGVDTVLDAFKPREVPINPKDARISGDGMSMVPKKVDPIKN